MHVPAFAPTGECDKELQKLEKLAEDASIAKEQLVEAASTAAVRAAAVHG